MRKNLANKLQSVHMPNAYFGVSVNIGEENFGKECTICQLCQFAPAKFSCVW